MTKDHGVIPQSRTYGKDVASADRSGYRLIRRGQFAMAPMALYYGAIGRLEVVEEGIISPAYRVFELDGTVDDDYVAALLRSPRMVARYGQWARGGNKSGKRRMTSFRDFCRIEVLLPPLDEQRARARALREADDGIAHTRGLLDGLRAARRWTLSRLLTEGHPVKGEGIGRWSTVKLGSFIRSIESGFSPQAARKPAGIGQWGVLKTSAVSGMAFRPEENKRLDDEATWRADLAVQPGDLLMSRANSPELVGSIVKIGGTPPKRLLSDKLWRLVLREDVLLPSFAVQLLRADRSRRYIEKVASGSSASMKNISQRKLRQMPILLPPLDEQRAIAAVGEAFDSRIAAESAVLDRLVALKQGLARELLSGRLRVPPALVARLADGDGGG